MAGRELNELEDELAVAAAEERYSAAAALKTRMDTLNERDVAAAVVAQMDELLENEKCVLGSNPWSEHGAELGRFVSNSGLSTYRERFHDACTVCGAGGNPRT